MQTETQALENPEVLPAQSPVETDPESPTRRPVRYLVRHAGLNGQERRKMARIVRTSQNGSPEQKFAALVLKTTPKNHPIRRIRLNDVESYVFEPKYWDFCREYEKYQQEQEVKMMERFDAASRKHGGVVFAGEK